METGLSMKAAKPVVFSVAGAAPGSALHRHSGGLSPYSLLSPREGEYIYVSE